MRTLGLLEVPLGDEGVLLLLLASFSRGSQSDFTEGSREWALPTFRDLFGVGKILDEDPPPVTRFPFLGRFSVDCSTCQTLKSVRLPYIFRLTPKPVVS